MTKNALPISIQIGMETIAAAGSVEAALTQNRDSSLAADVLLAHFYSVNPGEALRLAAVYS